MVGSDSGRGKRKDLRGATSVVLQRHMRQEMRQIRQQIIRRRSDKRFTLCKSGQDGDGNGSGGAGGAPSTVAARWSSPQQSAARHGQAAQDGLGERLRDSVGRRPWAMCMACATTLLSPKTLRRATLRLRRRRVTYCIMILVDSWRFSLLPPRSHDLIERRVMRVCHHSARGESRPSASQNVRRTL